MRVLLATLALALLGAPVALADLAPPSAPPPVSKRKCASYVVVKTDSGPRARCAAFKTDALPSRRQRQANSLARGASSSTWRPRGRSIAAPNHRRSARRGLATARHAARPGQVLRQANDSQPRAASRRGAAGTPLAVVLAIAGGILGVAAALAASIHKRLGRWRDPHPPGVSADIG